MAERCGINESSHVLDIGCGTGGNAVYLVEHFGCRVTGIDISELMIEQAKRRIEGHEHEDRLEFYVGDAYELGFPDESFDAVLTVFVSQLLDLEMAFPEFMRVLKPGGRFYCEEILSRYITHPIIGKLMDHPQEDRFDQSQFIGALQETGFQINSTRQMAELYLWVVATKSQPTT